MESLLDDSWTPQNMRLTLHSMKGSSVPRHCAVMEAGMPSNECPSSEWNFVQTWLSLTQNSVPMAFRNQSGILKGASIAPSAIQLTGKTSNRQYRQVQSPVYLTTGNSSSIVRFDSADSSTQQAVIADALTSISSIWDMTIGYAEIGSHHGASFHDDQKVVHTIAENYYQPYSSVSCVRDAIRGPNDQRVMSFPIFPPSVPGTQDYLDTNASISGVPAVEVPIRRAQLLELPGTESDNRVKWIQLPQKPLMGVSVGFIVLLPKNPSGLSKQSTTAIQNKTDIVLCSIGAGWGVSSINMTSATETNSATSSRIKFDESSIKLETTSPFSNPFQDFTDVSVLFVQPLFPSIPIEIDVEWAEYLNPYVPSANTTVIDLLMKYSAINGSKSALPEVAARNIISGLMTNGLARSGFTSELQGKMKLIKGNQDISQALGLGNFTPNTIPDGNLWLSGKSDIFTIDPEESKNWVKLKVDSTIQGYAYNIEGPAPKIAIAFLLTYCSFVLSHFVYSGISGILSPFHIKIFPHKGCYNANKRVRSLL